VHFSLGVAKYTPVMTSVTQSCTMMSAMPAVKESIAIEVISEGETGIL
jgi:hypothetical protein